MSLNTHLPSNRFFKPDTSTEGPAPVASVTLSRALAIASLVFLVLMAVSGLQQILDPFVRHDDYGALLLQPDAYYAKTLSEGRWLNYWWHLRPFETPVWLNYALYQGGWAVFCAGVAFQISRTKQTFYVAYLAVLVSLAPQAIVISGWFNTLTIGIWTIAIYAFWTQFLTRRQAFLLLAVFIPFSLLAYSTYPLLLLGVFLLRSDGPRSLLQIAGTLAFFAFCFWLGLNLINLLNYLEHGVYGLQIADWRTPTPARDLPSLMANMHLVSRFFSSSLALMGFSNTSHGIFIFLLLGVTLVLIARADPPFAMSVLAVLGTGFGLLIAHMLLEGTHVPFRATGFLWLSLVASLVAAAEVQLQRSERLASLARISLLGITFFSAYMASQSYKVFSDWQTSTHELASVIPGPDSTVYIYGSFIAPKGGLKAGIQEPRGLRLRLVQLTGARVILCQEDPDLCAAITPPFDPWPRFEMPAVAVDGNLVYLRLPAVDAAP